MGGGGISFRWMLMLTSLKCSRDAGGVAGAERLAGELHSLGKCSYHGTNSYALRFYVHCFLWLVN